MNDHRITKSVLSNIFEHGVDLDGLDDDEVEMMINEDDHSNYSPFEDNMLYILSLYVVQYALILTLINPIFSIIIMAAWLFVIVVSEIDDYISHFPTHKPSPNPTPLLRFTFPPTASPTTSAPSISLSPTT